jgi:hypothetical protein
MAGKVDLLVEIIIVFLLSCITLFGMFAVKNQKPDGLARQYWSQNNFSTKYMLTKFLKQIKLLNLSQKISLSPQGAGLHLPVYFQCISLLKVILPMRRLATQPGKGRVFMVY